MIQLADAPITTQQVDQGNKATLPWISWYTQLVSGVRGLMNAFTVGSSNAVTVANPGALQFGNWVTFTPTVNSASAGAASVVSGAGAYLRVGQLVQLQMDVTLTLSSALGIIYLNMPVASVGLTFNSLSCAISNSSWNTAIAMTQGTLLPILTYNNAPFPTGNTMFVINGTYRAV